MMKNNKNKKIMNDVKNVLGSQRQQLCRPRATVFADKSKYNRRAEKARLRREEW